MFRRLRWWQAVVFRARRIANETLGFLQLWRKSIQKVEGKHGAGLSHPVTQSLACVVYTLPHEIRLQRMAMPWFE